MKKIIGFILILTVCCTTACLFSVDCTAEGNEFAEEVYDSVPEDVQRLFEKMGITSIDFDSVFDVSAQDVFDIIKKLLTGAVESPLVSVVRLIAIILILSLFGSFVPTDSKVKDVMSLAGILFCVISIVQPLLFAVTSAVSSISVAEKFMLVLIPVLTGIVSASGNPSLALSFQSIAFVAAQALSLVASEMLVPVVGIVLSLDIAGSMMPYFSLNSLTDVLKKSITAVMSFSATIFVSFLGLKAGLANTADSLLGRGMKLVISSAVPVVGGALSEAYSGIVGSMLLVKSTVGVFGIGAIALITLPSCIQLLVWIFALKISAGIAEMFEQKPVGSLLKAISSSLVLLNVIIIFIAVLFIISTALILVLKAG